MKRQLVIGIDEVGRGALAGPVLLCAVAKLGPIGWTHPALGRIRDSKRLTPKRRAAWCAYLSRHPALSWRVARVGPRVIDRINISRAADLAAARLVTRTYRETGEAHVLLDGGLALPAGVPHRTIIRGDENVPLIAAASIIAKVTRDRYMTRLARAYPAYGFEAHKGYGTRVHRAAILRHGCSAHHRRTFLAAILRRPARGLLR